MIRFFEDKEVHMGRACGRWWPMVAVSVMVSAHLSGPPGSWSMTLDEAVRIALKSSPEVRREEAGRSAARRVVSQAAGQRLPTVSLALSYEEGRTAFELPVIGPAGPTGGSALNVFDVANPFQTAISASLPLYTGGSLPGRLAQARAVLRAADRTVEARRRAVVLRVTVAYHGVLRAAALADAAVAAVNRSREIYRTTYKLHQAGLRSKADLLRSEVAMAAVERDFLLATNALELARSEFNDALCRDLNAPVDLVPDSGEPQELAVAVDEEIGRALTGRPELLALHEQVSAQEGVIRAARSSMLPAVSLNASGTVVDRHPSASPGRASWRVGGGLSWTLFDGAVGLNRYREAVEAREQARSSVQALERRIGLEVKQAYLGVREAFDRIGLADRRVRSAREGYRAEESGFREGRASQADLLNAQADLASAEAEMAAARHDHLIAWARLRFAVGAE